MGLPKARAGSPLKNFKNFNKNSQRSSEHKVLQRIPILLNSCEIMKIVSKNLASITSWTPFSTLNSLTVPMEKKTQKSLVEGLRIRLSEERSRI